MSVTIGRGNGCRLLRQAFVLLPALCGVAACGPLLSATTSDVAGTASAGIANAVGRSPAAATGIGLGVAAAANAGLQYVERDVHATEQNQIAAAAGKLDPGMIGTWNVVHSLPIENDEHGELIVTRLLGTPDFTCKEVVFSVDTEDSKKQVTRKFYTTMVCLDGKTWKWALSEPATARWGALQ